MKTACHIIAFCVTARSTCWKLAVRLIIVIGRTCRSLSELNNTIATHNINSRCHRHKEHVIRWRCAPLYESVLTDPLFDWQLDWLIALESSVTTSLRVAWIFSLFSEAAMTAVNTDWDIWRLFATVTVKCCKWSRRLAVINNGVPHLHALRRAAKNGSVCC